MKQYYPAIVAVIITVLVIILYLNLFWERPNENVKIRDIISNPEMYIGKEVVLNGMYGGWGSYPQCDFERMGMVTRSDYIIYDDTGCLYICASCEGVEYIFKEGDVNPSDKNTYGTKIKVKAFVGSVEGKPVLGKVS
ncbi:MAG: hypothetical protein DRP11_02255 [Candidatus Aenigmatarchaeota archaeon]|nr:MAG: hypothetical protein DRP11_02255 [Candidatus Aenigmarchaeota archaeon]